VAPAAYLYAVKVLSRGGSGNFSWLIAGLDWCINNGIHIASMSLSGAAPTAVGTMCDLAFARGVLLVAAAGNSGGPVEHPAKYASVIAVSAIDVANQLAPFSCRGPEIELCARGVDVLSTVPGGAYARFTGTSMACPHVSGAAALAWSTHRFPPAGLRRNVAIRRLLATTADNLGVPGRDNNFGFGRVDAEQAAFQFAVPPAIPGIP
jgi:subtilisin